MRWFALIPAAGGGARFGADPPKQYLLLEGKPVLQHALERVMAAFPLDGTLVLLARDDRWFDAAVGTRAGVTALRCGGPTRACTVRNGLEALSGVADDDDWIVVHDAVRPCVDQASMLRLQRELADDPVGGVLATPLVCTLKRAGDDRRTVRTERRDQLWRAQTPQMFRCGVLRRAFAQADLDHITDESQAVEALGERPRLVEGHATNLKVTFPDDLLLAAAVLAQQRAIRERSL